MQYTHAGESHRACLHHSHKPPGIIGAWYVLPSMFVCGTCVPLCARACAWCVTQWVSWVCWWCLPKLQRGWRFSTNPAPLEGLLILTTQFSHASCYYIREGGWERNRYTDCSLNLHSLTEINPLTSPFEASCKSSTNTWMSCILQLYTTLLLSHPFVTWSLSDCLSFPFSPSHSTHLSAALHCWCQQPGSPLYFWVPQIDTGR